MARIGRKTLAIPDQVTVELAGQVLKTKGPKGELSLTLPAYIEVKIEGKEIKVDRRGNQGQAKANHGLVRSLINNQIIGVTQGYKKTLEMVGTGYRVVAKGANLELAVGFSHKVEVKAQPGIKLSIEGNNIIHIEGIDKEKVGQMAADIRSIRPPEPYNGKGIKYIDEVIRRKQGKAAVG